MLVGSSRAAAELPDLVVPFPRGGGPRVAGTTQRDQGTTHFCVPRCLRRKIGAVCFLLCGRLFFHRVSPILGMSLAMPILLETVTHFGYGSCYAYSVGDSLTAAGTLGESDLSQYRTTCT